MDDSLISIVNALEASKVNFTLESEQVHVPLPKDFDTLVIEIWNDKGEDSITLLNGTFHDHGNLVAREYGLASREEAIIFLIESIFDGTFKMVRVADQAGIKKNTIWDTFSLAGDSKDLDYEIVEI